MENAKSMVNLLYGNDLKPVWFHILENKTVSSWNLFSLGKEKKKKIFNGLEVPQHRSIIENNWFSSWNFALRLVISWTTCLLETTHFRDITRYFCEFNYIFFREITRCNAKCSEIYISTLWRLYAFVGHMGGSIHFLVPWAFNITYDLIDGC